jgi:CRISPR-associated endonuclease Cas2
MHCVISYDIGDDRLRGAIVRILERHGCRRLQKSVFLARDFSTLERAKLWRDVERLCQKGKFAPSDSVVLLPLSLMEKGELRAKTLNTDLTFLFENVRVVRL